MNALGYVTGGPLPNQVMLSRWFDAGRGKAMGIAYLGIGVGGALVPLLAHRLTEAFGWRSALQILGVLMIAIAFPLALLVRDERETQAATSAVPAQAAASTGTDSILDVLRQPAFYLLALGSMASIGAVGGTTQNLKLYFAMDRGMAQGSVAELISLVLVGSIAGRLLMGFLADRWSKKRVMLLVYLIVASTIPLLWAAPSPTTLRAAAVLFGIGLGGDYMIIPLMAAELFGLRRMGRVMGIVLTADGVAEAVVPMAVATLRDRSGSYGPGFALLVCLAALGAVAVSLLPRRSATRGLSRGGFTTSAGTVENSGRGPRTTIDQQATPGDAEEGEAGAQGRAPRPARRGAQDAPEREGRRRPRHRRDRAGTAAGALGRRAGRRREVAPRARGSCARSNGVLGGEAP